MSDTIDRQAMIDAVEESRRFNHHQDKKMAYAHEHEHRHFLKMLMEFPPVQLEPQWTPCNNTIDIPDYEILCCDKRGNELIGWLFYSNGQWVCESNGEIMYNTIAWMPLPKPYKEADNG